MNSLAQVALSLSAFPLSIVVKATVVLGVAFLILRCTRPAAASARHLVLAAAFAVLAALPPAERVAPSISIPVDASATAPLLPITRTPMESRRRTAPHDRSHRAPCCSVRP